MLPWEWSGLRLSDGLYKRDPLSGTPPYVSTLCQSDITTRDRISQAFSLPVSDGGRNEATVKPHAANLSYAGYKIAYRRTGFDCVVYIYTVYQISCAFFCICVL